MKKYVFEKSGSKVTIIVEETEVVEKAFKKTFDAYVNILASEFNLSKLETLKTVGRIAKVAPMAAISLLLRVIAKDMDSFYSDNIRNCKELYGLDKFGGVIKIKKEDIASYKGFAGFRTAEDAKYAAELLSFLYKEVCDGK